MGDSDSIDSGEGEYIGGTTSTHLQTMNFKTLVAPVAALALAIGSATTFAPEAKAKYYGYGGYQGTTNLRVRQRGNGDFQIRNTRTGGYTNYRTRSNGFSYRNSNGTSGRVRIRY